MDGTVVLGLKRAWSDGTTALELSASELVEKCVVILPPPRAKEVMDRGVLAANARLRRKVVPKLREAAQIKSPTMPIKAGRGFIGEISAIIGGRMSSGLPPP